ncbi:MAG: hypothetical protein AB7I50_11780 [Vicinamibacterales bacterium]
MTLRHLTRERLLLAVEKEGHDDPHLDTCLQCRAEVDALRSVLREVRELEAPEPSPLFWEVLSRRIQGAVRHEPPAAASRRAAWLPWCAWAGGLTTAASLALLSFVPRPVPATAPDIATASGADGSAITIIGSGAQDQAALPDRDWEFLLDVAASADGWMENDPITADIGAAETLVADFSDEERARLVDLLKAERAEFHQ